MKLLCPNCQKMLTVPEEFAGRLMKCPLCAGTFNVPGLPSGGAAPEPAAAVPPLAPVPTRPQAPADTYSLQPEAPPPVPAPAAAPEAPPPPAPVPASPAAAVATVTEPAGVPPSPPPSTAAAPTMGYTKSYTMSFHPEVVRWVPAVAVVLIFILQFLPWVGVYPGGVPAAWQNGWEAAFGSYGEDHDMLDMFQFKDNRPGVNLLLIFYFLPFFVVTLVVTVGVLVVTLKPMKLPGTLEGLLRFRWTLVAGLNLLTFLFLLLQLILGFSIEKSYQEQVADRIAKDRKDEKRTVPSKQLEAMEKVPLYSLHRTRWLRLVFVLQLVAAIAAALMAWVEKRGNRPPPRLVLET
jgi:hypothetical protein